MELIYTPSQIALACWHLVSPQLAEQWARAKFEPDVIEILPAIAQMITDEGKPPDVERVREIDKRLRICKNPEKVVGTKAYVHFYKQNACNSSSANLNTILLFL